jgi:endonuclease YncB( thermonuclease family)
MDRATHPETRPWPLNYALPALLAVLLAPAITTAAERIDFPSEPVTVARVIDGDTFAIEALAGIATDEKHPNECRYRVRLIGVNTPESYQTGFEQAQKALAALLPEGMVVTLTRDLDDRDGNNPFRWLAYVELPGGKDVGAELLKEGWAVAWRYLPNCRNHVHYQELMAEAWTNQLGLFAPGMNAVYVASKEDNHYHRPDCPSAGQISPVNLVVVYKAQDFVTAGKTACRLCLNEAEDIWD